MLKLNAFQAILFIPFIVMGALTTSMTSNSFFGLPKTAITQPKPLQAQKAEELPLPANGEVIRYVTPAPEEQLAPLSIITDGNPNGPHYFIKLANWSTNQTMLTLFLRAGLKTSVEVPLGTYKVKIASGKRWHGINKVFGPTTEYYLIAKSSGDSKMVFEIRNQEVMGHKLILRNVRNGNVRKKPISPKEF